MASFKKTEILQHPREASDYVEGGWGRWEQPLTIQEYGAINKIDISSQSPNYIAITSYAKVLIYNPVIKDAHKTVTKFKDAALGAKFRKDGKLLCVGTSEGQLKVFDVASKTILRIFRGHTTASHRCDFTADLRNVVSFSDDKTVRLWDLASETELQSFSKHTDYIRCGVAANVSSDLIVSGSYDQTVLLWDRRVKDQPVLSICHDAPIEDVLMLPGDGLIVSAGGTTVKIWDIAAGGKLLASLSPHHKTITCLCMADSGGSVVTGSLDRQAKRLDMQNFQVTGSISFPSSLLSVGVDPENRFVVGGMIDGLVQIFERSKEKYVDGVKVDSRRFKKERSHRYLKYTHFNPAPGDIIVDAANRTVELRHDQLLRKYEYSKALDQTLKPFLQRKSPQYAHSLLYELMRRDGLKTALIGRDERSLILILTYVNKYVTDLRFTKVLLFVAEILVEMYLPMSSKSNKVEKLFADLLRKLEREVNYVRALTNLQGSIELVIASANAGKSCTRIEKELLTKTSQSEL